MLNGGISVQNFALMFYLAFPTIRREIFSQNSCKTAIPRQPTKNFPEKQSTWSNKFTGAIPAEFRPLEAPQKSTGIDMWMKYFTPLGS